MADPMTPDDEQRIRELLDMHPALLQPEAIELRRHLLDAREDVTAARAEAERLRERERYLQETAEAAMAGWKKADDEAEQARAQLAKTHDHRAYLQERLRNTKKEAAGRKAHGQKLRAEVERLRGLLAVAEAAAPATNNLAKRQRQRAETAEAEVERLREELAAAREQREITRAQEARAKARRGRRPDAAVSHAVAQRDAVALAAEKEWERHGEETAAFERTIAELTAELTAERDQLRYERTLLGAARTLLDRIATGGLRGWAQFHREVEDLAQRIVDEIGHPTTDEPALGPTYREQIQQLRGLAEEALHLRMHGECAPGGTETWAAWDCRASTVLRGLAETEAGRG